jgi:hypothetical protein
MVFLIMPTTTVTIAPRTPPATACPMTEQGKLGVLARTMGRGQGQCLSLKSVTLTWERARSNSAQGRAPSHDTLNHSVSVDGRGLRGVRLPLFLCGAAMQNILIRFESGQPTSPAGEQPYFFALSLK